MGRSHLFAGVLSVFFCAFALFGQGTAQLGGRVTDQTAAVIPGANVTVTNTNTGVKWETTTTAEGYYVVPGLPPGSYSVSVRQEGFRTVTRAGLVLETGFKRTVDIELPVGSVTERVDVTAEAPLLEAEDSSVGQLIERNVIQNLPGGTNRRSAELARLSGNVIGGGTSIAIAGGRGQNQNWYLDGTTVQGSTLNTQYIYFNPPAESLQEFKVEQSNYSLEYSRSAGGHVVMTTRSGTNQFHGAVYEFLRNEKLNARGFFASSKGPLRYNVFGASAGGPIIRNRTFFFVNYEGTRQHSISNRSAVVPWPDAVNGDFSKRTDLNVIDPLTKKQFPNNIIPPERLDPVGLAVAKLYPAPNWGAMDVTKIEKTNYRLTQVVPNVNDFYTIKIDHDFNVKNKLFVRYMRESPSSQTPPLFPKAFGQVSKMFYNNLTGGWFHQFTPATLNDLRINYGRWRRNNNNGGGGSGMDGKLGLTGTDPDLFSTFTPSGITGMGGSKWAKPDNHTGELTDNFSWVRGPHQIKTGFNFRYGGAPYSQQNAPQFSFNGRVTKSGFADLLLGRVNKASSSGNYDAYARQDDYGAFIQDDWKVSRNLTLNIGLRWEMETPRWDGKNQLTGFDAKAINPVCNCPGVVTFMGVNGVSKYKSGFDTNNFGPRFGFAWRKFGVVVRGGYSIHYNGPYTSGETGVSQAFSYGALDLASPDGGTTPAFLLRSGVPARPQAPHDSSYGAVPIGDDPYFSPSFFQWNQVSGYAHQWNLGIQREVRGKILLEMAYLGNAGHHLGDQEININVVPLVNGRGPLEEPERTMLPYPQFNEVLQIFPPWGNSIYNALSLKAEKRYSHGLNFMANYTWSKFIDNCKSDGDQAGSGDGQGHQHLELVRLDRSVSGNDIRHRFISTAVYELPFGEGRRWKIGNRVLRHIAGGWSFGMILEMQSGMPYNAQEQDNRTNTFGGQQRPNLLRNPSLPGDRPLGEKLEQWFDVTAFEDPGPGRFGNAPRMIPGGPSMFRFDTSIKKTWNFTERFRLKFTGDFFNMLNHPSFSLQEAMHGTGEFGMIRRTRVGSRDIQLSLRLEF